MLDLNLEIISSESSCGENKMINTDSEKLPEAARSQMEDSTGTSNSSIINTEEAPANAGDENSSNTTSAFIFDILKKETINNKEDNTTNETNPQHPLPDFAITHQLFPVTGEKAGTLESEFGPGPITRPPARPQWLNLSYADPSGQTELRNIQQKQQQVRKSRRGPRSRSSQYRGVTFYRRTGRWESHIWDCGKQVYLGGFDTAHAAARAYDRAAIKFRGVDADINFNLSDYDEDMKQMKHLSKEEFVHILRRQSTGFARGNSKYRGVTLHKCGRWEARMGQFLGKKAYDMAAIKINGREAVTNFEPSCYAGEVATADASRSGNFHNLDLSLGISSPTVHPSGHSHSGDFHFHCTGCAMPGSRGNPMLCSSASAPALMQPHHGTPGPSLQPSMVYVGYPHRLAPNNEERGAEKKVEALFPGRWTWQGEGNGSNNSNMTQTPLIPIAASSGFSLSSANNTINNASVTSALIPTSIKNSLRYYAYRN